MSKSPKFIVVIGASAGGLNALAEMAEHFQKGLDVAYCIVLHLSHKGIGDYVVHHLADVTNLHCTLAKDGIPIQKDHIYIACPNQHLLVKDNKLLLGSGPEENRFRPSIDVLFRSAAVEFNTHAIGIILSGMLNDGTSGLGSVKKCGGTCIVQDPNEAEYPDMPLSVINNMEVNHVVSLREIGPLISQTIEKKKNKKKRKVPADIIAESKIAETVAIGIDTISAIAKEKS
jgi:two-component system chemotaxis response regulator CheB